MIKISSINELYIERRIEKTFTFVIWIWLNHTTKIRSDIDHIRYKIKGTLLKYQWEILIHRLYVRGMIRRLPWTILVCSRIRKMLSMIAIDTLRFARFLYPIFHYFELPPFLIHLDIQRSYPSISQKNKINNLFSRTFKFNKFMKHSFLKEILRLSRYFNFHQIK